MVKLEIPSWEVRQIRRSLESCGVDETAIFPDLEALGRSVTTHWRSESTNLPHQDVCARIQESSIHGVGVFAIRNIKKGTRIFAGDNAGMAWIEKKQIEKLSKEVQKLYTDFGVLKDGRYGCPSSFNQLTPAWYLNHSLLDPNVRCDESYEFFALRNIRKGEELTVNYSKYSQNEQIHP